MGGSLRARTTGRGRTLRLLAPLVATLLLVSAAPAQAGGGHGSTHPTPPLTVMTRNLYLGSSLAPAVGIDPGAPDAAARFVAAVGQIYATTVFTDFPTRARAIAKEIDRTEPDLIGLQEVSRWTATPVGQPSAAPASYDFLAILLAALAARGLDYSVAGVSDNAAIGPVPLIAPSAGCTVVTPVPGCVVAFADRDVVLVNDDTRRLRVGEPASGSFTAQVVLPSPAGPLSFDRGWVSVPVRYHGRSFTFVNTHLETEDFPAVQEAQAAEFLAGPASGPAVIATGDFNSAADGSTTSSYELLTGTFTDAWSVRRHRPGLTCCQAPDLTNPESLLRSRIDLVLSTDRIRPLTARVVGAEPFRRQTVPARPIWASDHAGVVARLQLR